MSFCYCSGSSPSIVLLSTTHAIHDLEGERTARDCDKATVF